MSTDSSAQSTLERFAAQGWSHALDSYAHSAYSHGIGSGVTGFSADPRNSAVVTSANSLTSNLFKAAVNYSAGLGSPNETASSTTAPHFDLHSPYQNATTSALAAALNPATASLLGATGFLTQSIAHSTTPTPKKKAQPVPDNMKDDSYWERRKKNNESARRSRECRRQKEEDIRLRAVWLEQENKLLKIQYETLKADMDRLHQQLFALRNGPR